MVFLSSSYGDVHTARHYYIAACYTADAAIGSHPHATAKQLFGPIHVLLPQWSALNGKH
jgi:hypothetical protein